MFVSGATDAVVAGVERAGVEAEAEREGVVTGSPKEKGEVDFGVARRLWAERTCWSLSSNVARSRPMLPFNSECCDERREGNHRSDE